MQIKKYKIIDFSKVKTVFTKGKFFDKVCYYLIDIIVQDKNDEESIKIISKIIYSRWELRKIKKLKYLHIIEEDTSDIEITEEV